MGTVPRGSGRARQRVYRRRRLVAALVLVAVVASALAAARDDSAERRVADVGAEAEAPPELPGGGRELFPDRRVVAFYGAPQDEELGELGIGTPASAARRLERQAAPYETEERPVLPALELIATIADADPGQEQLYRTRQEPAVIRRYLRAARSADALLVLDVQPGRADFLSEVKALRRFLVEPDVGLALDPEWRMAQGQVPGQVIGSVEASEVNRVATYLGRIVARNRLPEKLLLVHQFTTDMIRGRQALESPPGVALTLNVDGFGTPEAKRQKYHELVRLDRRKAPRDGSATGDDGSASPSDGSGPGGGNDASGRSTDRSGGRRRSGPELRFPVGFKLFYREDTQLMKPRQVLRLRPPPDVVIYE